MEPRSARGPADGFLRGGIFANWGSGVERSVEEDLKNPPVDGDEAGTLLRHAVDEHRRNGPLAAMWRAMPYRDSWSDFTASRFWLEGSAGSYREATLRSGVALYIFGGFADDFRREGLVAYASLAGLPRKITIGPWGHCRNEGFDLLGEARRFFDHHLKGQDTGLMREPPVRFYVQGAPEAEAWRQTAQWPPAESRPQTWTLSLDGSQRADQTLHPAAGDSKRTAKASVKAAAHSSPGIAQQPAAKDRIGLSVQPAIACGADWNPQAPTCDQSANALRFAAAVLTQDVELVGHPLLRLWLAADRPDPNVFAYLEDVAPDGRVLPVTDGRLKASLRKLATPPMSYLGLPWQRSLEEDHAPLSPGQFVELQFDLLPLAHRFKAGHRIRVSITGSDPRERTPAASGSRLTLASSATHPSTITLPVMAANTSAKALAP